jgi:hypothetical protein
LALNRAQSLGALHLDTAAAQHLLGEVLTDIGGERLPEAEAAFCSSMATRERLLGLHHPHTAVTMLGNAPLLLLRTSD